MFKPVLLMAGFIATTTIAATPVAATSTQTTFNASVPISTIIYGDPNTSHNVASIDINDAYVGMSCSVSASAENQSSVHPGNDLVVSSEASSVVLENVERSKNVGTTASGSLTLGNVVDVTLVLGQDGVFSGGMDVELTCIKEFKDIEVCRDGEVITIGEDEKLSSDTNAPCPVTEIEICRDGKIITINEDDRKADDHDTCAQKGFEVCRDGDVITITENDRKSTDIKGDTCPQVLSLPNTGATETAVIALISAALISGSYGLIRSKHQ